MKPRDIYFWENIEVRESGCWQWVGAEYPNGYGHFVVSNKPRISTTPHRWSYERIVGRVPSGLDLDHLCRNRLCANPAHLEPVTRAENLRRSPIMGRANSRKTHCPAGHEYAGENLYVVAGRRQCVACKNEKRRRAWLDPVKADRMRAQAAAQGRKARRRGGRVVIAPQDRTHCPRGHSYSGDNLAIERNGKRRCVACSRLNNRKAYLKRKGRLNDAAVAS